MLIFLAMIRGLGPKVCEVGKRLVIKDNIGGRVSSIFWKSKEEKLAP